MVRTLRFSDWDTPFEPNFIGLIKQPQTNNFLSLKCAGHTEKQTLVRHFSSDVHNGPYASKDNAPPTISIKV